MDVLSRGGIRLEVWIPGAGGLFGAPQYHLSAGNHDDRRQCEAVRRGGLSGR